MYHADKNKHIESINLPSVTVASILATNPPLIGSLFIGADDAGAGVVAAVQIILYKQQIQGCPTKFGVYAILVMALYIISYAPGMGTVPWVVNSEIYPLRYRGFGGGTPAVANWTSNLIVSQTFLTLNTDIGVSRDISPICRVLSFGTYRDILSSARNKRVAIRGG